MFFFPEKTYMKFILKLSEKSNYLPDGLFIAISNVTSFMDDPWKLNNLFLIIWLFDPSLLASQKQSNFRNLNKYLIYIILKISIYIYELIKKSIIKNVKNIIL